MTARISRRGRLVEVSADESQVEMATPCSSCRISGCTGSTAPLVVATSGWADGGGTRSRSLSGAAAAVVDNSGRIPHDVDVSVSRRGLTLAMAAVFGPTLIVLALLAQLSSSGYSGGAFAGAGLLALLAALLLGAACGRRLAAGLVDLKLVTASQRPAVRQTLPLQPD